MNTIQNYDKKIEPFRCSICCAECGGAYNGCPAHHHQRLATPWTARWMLEVRAAYALRMMHDPQSLLYPGSSEADIRVCIMQVKNAWARLDRYIEKWGQLFREGN